MTPASYGVTSEGLTVYKDGQAVLHVPASDLPRMIARLAQALDEANRRQSATLV